MSGVRATRGFCAPRCFFAARSTLAVTLLCLALGAGCAAPVSIAPPVVITVVVTPTPRRMSLPDTPAPDAPAMASSSDDVLLEGVSVGEGTVAVTLTISACATAAYLFDAPEMAGQIAVPEALEGARFALLDCVAAGRATVVLAFPRPEEEPPWALVLNPQHEPGSAVAPRVEMTVSP